MREKSKYYKMNSSSSEFAFSLSIYFLLLHMFLTFKVVFRMLMADMSVPFGFNYVDSFDRVVFHFNSRNCIQSEIMISDNP